MPQKNWSEKLALNAVAHFGRVHFRINRFMAIRSDPLREIEKNELVKTSLNDNGNRDQTITSVHV